MKQSISATGTTRVPVSVKAGKLLSWAKLAKFFNSLPLDVCHCDTENDAKGYTYAAVVLILTFVLSGIAERIAL